MVSYFVNLLRWFGLLASPTVDKLAYREAIGIHRIHNRKPWESIGIHGNPLRFMGIHTGIHRFHFYPVDPVHFYEFPGFPMWSCSCDTEQRLAAIPQATNQWTIELVHDWMSWVPDCISVTQQTNHRFNPSMGTIGVALVGAQLVDHWAGGTPGLGILQLSMLHT